MDVNGPAVCLVLSFLVFLSSFLLFSKPPLRF